MLSDQFADSYFNRITVYGNKWIRSIGENTIILLLL